MGTSNSQPGRGPAVARRTNMGPAWALEHNAPELEDGKILTRYAVVEETFTIGQDWEHTDGVLVPASAIEVTVESMQFRDDCDGWPPVDRALAWARRLVAQLEAVR